MEHSSRQFLNVEQYMMISTYYNFFLIWELFFSAFMMETENPGEGGLLFLESFQIAFSFSHKFYCEILNLSGTELFEDVFHNLLGQNENSRYKCLRNSPIRFNEIKLFGGKQAPSLPTHLSADLRSEV